MGRMRAHRWACAVLLCLLLGAHAEDQFVVQGSPSPSPVPAYAQVTPPPFYAWLPLAPDGFLPQGETPYVHADEPGGRWIYIAQDLRVEINRFSANVRGRNTVWYISHIHFRGDTAFRSFLANPEKPGRGRDRPENIATKNQVVYAQNGDLFTYRIEEKRYPGIVIRNGGIVHSKTYTKRVTGVAPLDELALFPDGRMEVRFPGDITAEDYLALGATDVFAFGPILIQDGVRDERLEKAWNSYEPRSAIGLVAPGHAVGILVEGRNKRSDGMPLRFVADRLLEQGCVMAYILDGGQTAAMIFLGKNVMDPGTYNGFHKTRTQPDIIGIGSYEGLELPTK